MKNVKIKIHDIIKIKREIPGMINLEFDAPHHEDKEIIIPRDTLLLYLKKFITYDANGKIEKEDTFFFDILVNYQLLNILDTYKIKPFECEFLFRKYSLSIKESILLNNYEMVIPFDYKYLTPEIEEHLNFVANEYQENKIHKNRTVLSQTTLKKFFNNEFVIKSLRDKYNKGFLTSFDVHLEIIRLMDNYKKDR
jgi:hypothetical protein